MDERDIFIQVIQVADAAHRAALVQSLCGQDQELRRRVDALLEAHGRAVDFLESPPSGLANATVDQPITEKRGSQIGPYKLLQQIGEGGFGVVYMADQTEPVKRRVALKIIKPGMDTRQVIARFEAERQALAMMDHPNIAKVLDAGQTDSGRPYFVMELVKGIPVTQYCDEQHLNPKQRLELFAPICQAVQHAHQKGIIHRDIKPTNILVTLFDGRPVPKVIDFGVAKATSQTLTEKTVLTELGQVVGTLEYMSPEQAQVNRLDIDTRSDVYSLGVLLYELLTGETPFDRQRLRSAGFDEVLRIIREEEPPKPSTKLSSSERLPSIAANRHLDPQRLTSSIRGELDWIVMKALEKDRARRYESASRLAEDVHRYLRQEPVLAGPPSGIYRLKKFVRRNTWPLTACAAVVISLALGLIATNWQLVRVRAAKAEEQRARGEAQAQRMRAEDNFGLARDAVQEMLTTVSQESLRGVPHLELVRRELLEKALDFHRTFLKSNRDDPTRQLDTAQALVQLADVHRELDEHQQAIDATREALQLLEQVPVTALNARYVSLRGHRVLGHAMAESGELASAEKILQDALRLPSSTDPGGGLPLTKSDASRMEERVQCYLQLGHIYRSLQRWPDAESAFTAGIEEAARLADTSAGKDEHLYLLAKIESGYAQLLSDRGRTGEARDLYRKCAAQLKELAAANQTNALYRQALATVLANLGTELMDPDGDSHLQSEPFERGEMRQVAERSVTLWRGLVREFPAVPGYQRGLAMSLNSLGLFELSLNRLEPARNALNDSLESLRVLRESYQDVPQFHSQYGAQLHNVSCVWFERGDFQAALPLLQEAEAAQRQALAIMPTERQSQAFLRNHLWQLARVAIRLEDREEAVRAATRLAKHALSPQDPFQAACVTANCRRLIEREEATDSPEKARLIDQYSEISLDFLRQALDMGFRDLQQMQQRLELDPLRDHPDFKALLARLEDLVSDPSKQTETELREHPQYQQETNAPVIRHPKTPHRS